MLIYLARNRVNGKCYLGLTSRSLAVRQAEHLADARRGATTAFQLEIKLIAEYGAEYNEHKGGNGGPLGIKHSEEVRARQSKVQSSRTWNHKFRIPCSDEKRAKLKGRTRTPEQVQNMRVPHNYPKGRVFSEETKAKIAASIKKKWEDRKGFKHSEETKSKMRAAHKARKESAGG